MASTKHLATGTFLAIAVVVLLSTGLAGTATASAAEADRDGAWGPNRARMPVADWQPLPAGENHWYAFNYAGDGSQITIQLQAEPAGTAGFVVWTPDQIYLWGLGQYVEPVGRSLVAPSIGGHQAWSGNFRTSGTYYIVAEHTGNQPGVSYYLLTVEGDGFTLPPVVPAPATATAAWSQKIPSKATPPGDAEGTLLFQTTPGGLFYTIDVDGTNRPDGSAGSRVSPAWSPDGAYLAFLTDQKGEWQIWIMEADGRNPQPLVGPELDGLTLVYDFNDERALSWTR